MWTSNRSTSSPWELVTNAESEAHRASRVSSGSVTRSPGDLCARHREEADSRLEVSWAYAHALDFQERVCAGIEMSVLSVTGAGGG